MCSVRDDSLDDTRESIQNTCTLAFVHPVAGSDIVGKRSHCDDGYRIVGCAEIGDAHQSRDAKFGSAFAVDVFGQFLDDIVHSAIKTDQFQHTACHQGDDDELTHPGDPCAHGAEPVEQADAPREQADHSRCGDAQYQYECHIHTCYGASQHNQVGEDFDPFHRLDVVGGHHVHPSENIVAENHQSGRKGYHEVYPELVTHGASLGTGGGDGGIRDE